MLDVGYWIEELGLRNEKPKEMRVASCELRTASCGLKRMKKCGLQNL